MRIRALACAAWLSLVGCGAERAPAPGEDDAVGPDTAEALDDGKSDVTELRVRSGVTTLWVDKVTEVDAQGAARLTIHGRTSRDLASVSSWVPEDAFGTASVVGPRSFTIVLDEGHEINTLLSGLPLLVSIETKTGNPSAYTARLELVSRLAGFKGSSKLHPSSVIEPIFVRDDENPLRYRGKLRSDVAVSSLAILTDEAADPALIPLGQNQWHFDWTYDALALAAFPRGDAVSFSASTTGESLVKSARFEHRVLRLAMTTKAPDSLWPSPACDPEVAACVQATAGDDLDACGTYREVSRCQGVAPPGPELFASDLSEHLVAWYATYGADVAAAGGNTLEQAQQAIDPSTVTELTDPAEDPHGHDFADTIVLSHPDVVFLGSDNVWFGAYERASGALLEIYDFN